MQLPLSQDGPSSSVPGCAEPRPACAQVPYRLLKAFHKVQQRLVRELEKKFSGKDVVLIANRRIMPTPSSGKTIARPRSRTLTAVRCCGCNYDCDCAAVAATMTVTALLWLRL